MVNSPQRMDEKRSGVDEGKARRHLGLGKFRIRIRAKFVKQIVSSLLDELILRLL